MQVLQAGQHKLILLEIDPAAVSEVAGQAGFEVRARERLAHVLMGLLRLMARNGRRLP